MVDLSSLPPPQLPKPNTIVYEPMPGARWISFVVIAVFAAATIPMTIAAASDSSDAPSPGFVAFWIVALLWNGYWLMLRIAYRLEVSHDVLSWRAPLRRGQWAISEIVDVRPTRWARNMAVLRHPQGRILVSITKDFQRVAESLLASHPEVPFSYVRRGRLQNWAPDAPVEPPMSVATLPTPTGTPTPDLPRPPVRPATPSWTHGPRFRWWYLLVLLVPIAVLVFFLYFWRPGTDPVVSDGDGPFFVGTVITDRSISLGPPEADLTDRSDAVLAAVCHNYFDWLGDVTLNPDLVIIEPSDGLLRSAELLDGEFEPTEAVLEAERLAATGLDASQVLEELRSEEWTSAEREEADSYLRARGEQPSPGARNRYVFYFANATTRSVLLFRLEVDVDEEIRRRGASTAGDLSLTLPTDDRVYGVNESVCWE